ncbi:unnamed protein product, partial [Allacma fusca]
MLESKGSVGRVPESHHGMRNYPSLRASEFANNTFNPIRSIVESMKLEPHPEKQMIALSI